MKQTLNTEKLIKEGQLYMYILDKDHVSGDMTGYRGNDDPPDMRNWHTGELLKVDKIQMERGILKVYPEGYMGGIVGFWYQPSWVYFLTRDSRVDLECQCGTGIPDCDFADTDDLIQCFKESGNHSKSIELVSNQWDYFTTDELTKE